MQYPRQQTELNLAECRQQLRKLAVSIDVVEQHIERVQHRLEHTQVWLRADETSASQQDIDQYQDLNQEQTVQHLWHELSRLGQKEDRLRQEKVITVQLELTLSEALLQLQSPRDLLHHIEKGRCMSKTDEPITGPHYRIIVRLIPPCLIACFLIGLFAWFGVDLQQETEGLSTTQKVASIGSASFTLMTIVALFVRAAMCTGEWQWLLQMCDRLTGWDLLQQKQQQQQPAARDMLPVFTAAPALPIQAIGIPEKCLDSGCNHHNQTVSIPSSPDSMNSSTIEEWKKQS